MESIKIAGSLIGVKHHPYVIAEISANHAQDYSVAEAIVHGCAEAGVDAIKLQTYTAETMTLDLNEPAYVINEGLWKSKNLFELYRDAETPWAWTGRLQALCDSLKVTLFSSPFDSTAVEFLESLNFPAYKIASFELTDLPLLRLVAGTGKPVIASTGMATRQEIDTAVATLRAEGCVQLALLKCTSSYPATFESLNLGLIPKMQQDFRVPIGFSDHTQGITAAVAAVALGACIIEKHVKTAGSETSPDAAFSATTNEMKSLVQSVSLAYDSIGETEYGPHVSELPMLLLRRSIVAIREIPAGSRIEPEDVAVLRPAIGLPPSELETVLGATVRKHISRGEGISWDALGMTNGD